MIAQPLDQPVAHGSTRRPDAAFDIYRLAQSDRAFRDHLRGRSITGIAIAAHRDANLPSVRCEPDEQEIVKAVLAFFFPRTLARLPCDGADLLQISGTDKLGV